MVTLKISEKDDHSQQHAVPLMLRSVTVSLSIMHKFEERTLRQHTVSQQRTGDVDSSLLDRS